MGVAKLKTSNATLREMEVNGTPYYAAPKTFKGKVGKSSDIWSFGIVMVELFGGARAWGNLKHHNELLAKIILKQIPSMNHLNPPARQLCSDRVVHQPENRKSILSIIDDIRSM